MFEELFNIANNKLECLDEKVIGLPETQVTVLATECDFYIAVNDIDGSICDELKSKEDTKILRMLTMWKSGHLDLPSLKFRKALVALDQYNYGTHIVLQGEDGFNSKKLLATMP